MYFTNEHLMGMFALGMTFLESTEVEYDQLISMVIAGKEMPEKVIAGLETVGQNFKANTEFQKLLTARKLKRMVEALETITR